MLKAKAEIMFTLENKNYSGKLRLQPVFNFGEDLLFSGTIKSDNDMYFCKQKYIVDIEFFTIYGEAYEAVKKSLKPNMNLAIQAGRRILGIARVSDFVYEESK
jgi:hypothetical protein